MIAINKFYKQTHGMHHSQQVNLKNTQETRVMSREPIDLTSIKIYFHLRCRRSWCICISISVANSVQHTLKYKKL